MGCSWKYFCMIDSSCRQWMANHQKWFRRPTNHNNYGQWMAKCQKQCKRSTMLCCMQCKPFWATMFRRLDLDKLRLSSTRTNKQTLVFTLLRRTRYRIEFSILPCLFEFRLSFHLNYFKDLAIRRFPYDKFTRHSYSYCYHNFVVGIGMRDQASRSWKA